VGHLESHLYDAERLAEQGGSAAPSGDIDKILTSPPNVNIEKGTGSTHLPTGKGLWHGTLAFWREPDCLHDALQVICAVVFNFDSTLFFAVMQNNAGAKIFLEPRLQMLHRAGID
jgi:hypothetical protein